MKKTKKITSIIVQIITAILFVFLIIIIIGKVQMIALKRDYATFFNHTLFQIASGSMEPELYVDDVVLVKTNAEYDVNDIISFKDGDTIVTHRVIAINGDSIIVQGDKNNSVDAPISRDAVIGKVVKVYKELKIWQDIFTNPKILIVLFITLLLFDLSLSSKNDDVTSTKKKESKNYFSILKEKFKSNKKIKRNKKKDDIKITQLSSSQEDFSEEDLIDFTRKIDLNEIDELLEKEKNQKEDVDDSNKDLKEEMLEENDDEERKDYTVRLDLKEIQKEIAKKVK